MVYNGSLGHSRLFEDFLKARYRLLKVTKGSHALNLYLITEGISELERSPQIKGRDSTFLGQLMAGRD